MKTLKRLLQEETGQDLVEYALLAAFAAFLGITINTLFVPAISRAFSTAAANLASTT